MPKAAKVQGPNRSLSVRNAPAFARGSQKVQGPNKAISPSKEKPPSKSKVTLIGPTKGRIAQG